MVALLTIISAIMESFEKKIEIVNKIGKFTIVQIYGFEKTRLETQFGDETIVDRYYINKSNDIKIQFKRLSSYHGFFCAYFISLLSSIFIFFLENSLVIKQNSFKLDLCKLDYECFYDLDYYIKHGLLNSTSNKDICKMNNQTLSVNDGQLACYKFGIDTITQFLLNIGIYVGISKFLILLIQLIFKLMLYIYFKIRQTGVFEIIKNYRLKHDRLLRYGLITASIVILGVFAILIIFVISPYLKTLRKKLVFDKYQNEIYYGDSITSSAVIVIPYTLYINILLIYKIENHENKSYLVF